MKEFTAAVSWLAGMLMSASGVLSGSLPIQSERLMEVGVDGEKRACLIYTGTPEVFVTCTRSRAIWGLSRGAS